MSLAASCKSCRNDILRDVLRLLHGLAVIVVCSVVRLPAGPANVRVVDPLLLLRDRPPPAVTRAPMKGVLPLWRSTPPCPTRSSPTGPSPPGSLVCGCIVDTVQVGDGVRQALCDGQRQPDLQEERGALLQQALVKTRAALLIPSRFSLCRYGSPGLGGRRATGPLLTQGARRAEPATKSRKEPLNETAT